MKNSSEISVICEQIGKTAECLRTYTTSSFIINQNAEDDVVNEMDEIAIQQVEHIQRMVLMLTELVVDGASTPRQESDTTVEQQ